MVGLTLMQSTTSGFYDFIVFGMFVTIHGPHFQSSDSFDLQCFGPLSGVPCYSLFTLLLHRLGNIIHRYIRYMYHVS